jgi:hypothetical protein
MAKSDWSDFENKIEQEKATTFMEVSITGVIKNSDGSYFVNFGAQTFEREFIKGDADFTKGGDLLSVRH